MEELFTIKKSTLEGIANAIRGQYGETDKIAVSDFAEAISGIEGGGSEIPSNVYMAEFSPIEPTNVITFEHTLGKTPYFWGVFAKSEPINPTYWWRSVMLWGDTTVNNLGVTVGSITNKNLKNGIVTATENSLSIDLSTSQYVSTIMFKDTDYFIIAICEGE